MGQTHTKDAEMRSFIRSKNQQSGVYRPPEVRKRDRFEVVENPPTSNLTDITLDKYDYLIVFPIGVEKQISSDTISWKEASAIWKQCIPGTDEHKDIAVKKLANFWQHRTNARTSPFPIDMISLSLWHSIARDVIIDQLSLHSGLQLKISASNKFIFCRVRAPIKLLELQAKRERYRLQLRGEVDPGSEEFWNHEINGVAVEIEEERRLYTLEEANIILEKLYRAGKISPNDLGVYSEKEPRSASFSRRCHVLERVADKVPVTSRHAAYVPFMAESHMRYLFATYPSVRGRTLFLPKDRLYLTKAIIDRYFDVGVIVNKKIADCFFALHDANRGEAITQEVLLRRWVLIWKASRSEIGAPIVSEIDGGGSPPLYLVPVCQPLNDIRNYFGEKIALYFAWLGHYTYCLMLPAGIGLIVECVNIRLGLTQGVDLLSLSFLVFFVCYTAVYEQSWNRNCKHIAILWGTDGFEDTEKERPQFQGDASRPVKRSTITNRVETNFPEEKRFVRQITSLSIVVVCIAALLTLIGIVFYFQYLLTVRWHYVWGYYICSLLSGLQIQLLNIIYKDLVYSLNEWENYRTDTAFEDNLVFKTFMFQLFNNFAALIFTAFVKGPVFDTCEDRSCRNDVRILLLSIFAIRYLKMISILFSSFKILDWLFSRAGPSDEESAEGNHKLIDDVDSQFALEISRENYEGTFDDFAEIVLQYGYMCFFSSIMPAICTLAVVENFFQIRMDAYTLCVTTRRPHVTLAEDVGMWVSLMSALSYVGVVVNVGLMCFVDDRFYQVIRDVSSSSGYSSHLLLWLLFLVAEQGLLLLKTLLYYIIPEVSSEVSKLAQRQKYITRKYIHGFEDLGEEEDLDALQSSVKGHLEEDWSALEDATLANIRATVKLSEKEVRDMEKLEGARREKLREIKSLKDQLQVAYRTENFNEATGVGETKHGLPLGRLNVYIETLQDVSTLEPIELKVSVEIKGLDGKESQPCPQFDASFTDTASKPVVGGQVEFKQKLGPFAPIRTQKAEIIFLILSSTGQLGSAKINLAELQDQKEQVKILAISRSELGYPQLVVSTQFQYSKVAPLKNRIYHAQDELREVERELAEIKTGKRAPV